MDGHDMVEGAGISRVFSRSEAGRTAVSANVVGRKTVIHGQGCSSH